MAISSRWLVEGVDLDRWWLDPEGPTYVVPRGAEWKGTKVSDTEVHYALSTETVDIQTFVRNTPSAIAKYQAKHPGVEPTGYTD
mgnify:CR=1 FL=1